MASVISYPTTPLSRCSNLVMSHGRFTDSSKAFTLRMLLVQIKSRWLFMRILTPNYLQTWQNFLAAAWKEKCFPHNVETSWFNTASQVSYTCSLLDSSYDRTEQVTNCLQNMFNIFVGIILLKQLLAFLLYKWQQYELKMVLFSLKILMTIWSCNL